MRNLCAFFIVIAMAASGSRAGAQHIPKLSVQNYDSEIELLLALSPGSASKQPKTDLDPRTIAARCADQLEKARSYGSLARILDRGNKELAGRNSVGISWVLDHVEPDRYHVVQRSWGGGPGYDFDEWITIGDSHFQFTGFWMEGLVLEAPGWDPRQQNRELGLLKYLQVLRGEQPVSADLYLYKGKHYYLLVYLFSADRHKEFPEFVASGPAQLRLWIDSESALLAQADFLPATNTPGREPDKEFEQVFVGYSGRIQIEPPREKCSKSRPRMCFVSRVLKPATAPGQVTERPAQEMKELSYSNPAYSWSVSYPKGWTIDRKDPSHVRISSPADDGLCGLQSGAVASKTVDEFTDLMQAYSERSFKERGVGVRSSPKQPISLPNDVTGIDVTTEIFSGGKSRRVYVLANGIGYVIDCETYVQKWEELSPFFGRIISSFTLEKK